VQLGLGTIKPTFHLIVLRGKQITLLFQRNRFKLQNIYHFLCLITADAYVLSHSRIFIILPLTVPFHSHNRVFLYTIGLDIIANSFHCVHSTIWYPENLCSVRLGAPALATPKISVENSPFHAMCMPVKATEALINSVKVTESHFFKF